MDHPFFGCRFSNVKRRNPKENFRTVAIRAALYLIHRVSLSRLRELLARSALFGNFRRSIGRAAETASKQSDYPRYTFLKFS